MSRVGVCEVRDEEVMNDSDKMIELMRRMRVEMNGVVVDSMREKGIEYPLSFGVSVPTIRELAEQYAPNHKLACLMWQQPIRELRLAAVTVAEPADVTAQELAFWVEGVTNSELAEHLASTLLGRTSVVGEVIKRYAGAENDLLKYMAFLTAARNIALIKSAPEWSWRAVLEDMTELNAPSLRSQNRVVWRGIALFMGVLIQYVDQSRELINGVITTTEQHKLPCANYLKEELGWQLESNERENKIIN